MLILLIDICTMLKWEALPIVGTKMHFNSEDTGGMFL
jgi:hypothetical protein